MTLKEICELRSDGHTKLGTKVISLWNYRAGDKPLAENTIPQYCRSIASQIRQNCPEFADKCDRILKTHKEKDVEKEIDQTLDLAHDLGLLTWLHLEDEPQPEPEPEPEPEPVLEPEPETEPDEEPRIQYNKSGLKDERRKVQDFIFRRPTVCEPDVWSAVKTIWPKSNRVAQEIYRTANELDLPLTTVIFELIHRTLIDHPGINPGWVLGYKGPEFRTITDPRSFGRDETWTPSRTQPSFDDYRQSSDEEQRLAFLDAMSYPGSEPCND